MREERFFNYSISSKLGVGMFGEVSKVKRLTDGRSFAMKLIKEGILRSNPRLLQMVNHEVTGMVGHYHPNMVTLHDAFRIKGDYFLIYELCEPQSLKTRMRNEGTWSEERLFDLTKSMLKALKDLHSMKILHRDIKPDNILMKKGEYKLADFGLCYRGGAHHDNDLIGSPAYLAPEIFKRRYYSEKSDVYALGITIFELYVGKYPFDQKNEQALLKRKTELMPCREILPTASPQLIALLTWMMHPVYESRSSVDDLIIKLNIDLNSVAVRIQNHVSEFGPTPSQVTPSHADPNAISPENQNHMAQQMMMQPPPHRMMPGPDNHQMVMQMQVPMQMPIQDMNMHPVVAPTQWPMDPNPAYMGSFSQQVPMQGSNHLAQFQAPFPMQQQMVQQMPDPQILMQQQQQQMQQAAPQHTPSQPHTKNFIQNQIFDTEQSQQRAASNPSSSFNNYFNPAMMSQTDNKIPSNLFDLSSNRISQNGNFDMGMGGGGPIRSKRDILKDTQNNLQAFGKTGREAREMMGNDGTLKIPGMKQERSASNQPGQNPASRRFISSNRIFADSENIPVSSQPSTNANSNASANHQFSGKGGFLVQDKFATPQMRPNTAAADHRSSNFVNYPATAQFGPQQPMNNYGMAQQAQHKKFSKYLFMRDQGGPKDPQFAKLTGTGGSAPSHNILPSHIGTDGGSFGPSAEVFPQPMGRNLISNDYAGQNMALAAMDGADSRRILQEINTLSDKLHYPRQQAKAGGFFA
jgi:serine/threonine protein kinase